MIYSIFFYASENVHLSNQAVLTAFLIYFSSYVSGFLTYRVVVFLGCHVGVAVTPVVVDLLLLFVVEPHQLLGCRADEHIERVQVTKTRLGGVLGERAVKEGRYKLDCILCVCIYQNTGGSWP